MAHWPPAIESLTGAISFFHRGGKKPVPVEQPTDFNGVVYPAAADTDLCKIVWIDPPPLDQDELRSLLDRAANALDAAAAP